MPPDNRRNRRVDLDALRERVDLTAVVVDLLGPAPGRVGEWGGRLYWHCIFHDDPNPSLCIQPGGRSFKCFGCGENGDAIRLAMAAGRLDFLGAVAYLNGGKIASSGMNQSSPRPFPRPRTAPDPPTEAETEAACVFVAESIARLWCPVGKAALPYLTGLERCLTPETIRAARLGWTDRARVRTRDRKEYTARGVVIPWFSGEIPALVQVRQPDGMAPKYCELHRNRARLTGLYPGPEAIRPGRPLIVVEGAFDALCLGQELGNLAAVVTLGSASARPTPAILKPTLSARPRYVAVDADAAGLKSAEHWSAGWRRVPPPRPPQGLDRGQGRGRRPGPLVARRALGRPRPEALHLGGTRHLAMGTVRRRPDAGDHRTIGPNSNIFLLANAQSF